MDNKIGSIDNDGNMTSNGMDDFNDMTSPTSNDGMTGYDITSYDSGLDSKNSNRKEEDENEEFDVFGNTKPQKEKQPIKKLIIIVPVAIIALINIIAL